MKKSNHVSDSFRLFRKPAKLIAQAVGFPSVGWRLRRRGNIVMLHVGRCGSSVIASLLRQHPDIVWHGEIFEQFRPYRGGCPEGFDPMRHLKTAMRNAGPGFYGFELKINYTQLWEVMNADIEQCLYKLKKVGISHFVILERKNYLRTVVSGIIGQKSGIWHARTDSPHQIRKIRLNLEKPFEGDTNNFSLIQLLDEINENYSRAKSALPEGATVLYMTYEHHIKHDPTIGYDAVVQFLNLPPHPANVTYQRTNPYPLNRLITNFGEVETALAETAYQWMLYD